MDADVHVETKNVKMAPQKGSRPAISSVSSDEADCENSVARKRERRRNKIIQEILDTEKTYQRHLDLIVRCFEGPLRESQLIPGHVIVTIFSNIRQIININAELCQHLKVEPIGKAFLMIGPFLKLYSTYANNHERALATLMDWDQKSPEFSEFRRGQEDAEEFHGLKLNALLITPVQRVPRYKLLLEDLLQYTDRNHDDYAALQEACSQIGAVAQHINEHIKQQDNFMKMLAIQKSLVGPLAPKILAPGRMFIKDGRLKKVSKNGGRSHERMFFLFSDILMYAKPKLLESGSLPSYNCCCILPLHHCTVNRVFGHSQGTGALFTIQCKEESLLLFSDQNTVDKWIKVLTLAIGKFVENRQSLRKESSAKVPVRRGALAKYRKQQEMSDPLAAKKTPPGSPKTPKTPKGFMKRSLKDSEPPGSPSTPSPKKKPGGQEAFMKTFWCLTPRSGRRKKSSRDDSDGQGGDNGENQNPADFPSSPQVPSGSIPETHHPADVTIGLDPSRIWKAGEDSTFMEHSTIISPPETSKDFASPSFHSSILETGKTKRPLRDNYSDHQPSPICYTKAIKLGEISKPLNPITEQSFDDDFNSQNQYEFANGVSFPPILHDEQRAPSSAGGISLSSNDFDNREMVRSKQQSNELSDDSGMSAIIPQGHDSRGRRDRFASVFNSDSDSDNNFETVNSKRHRTFNKASPSLYRRTNGDISPASSTGTNNSDKNAHFHETGSPKQRPSQYSSSSDVGNNSSFSTSMGEFDEDSLRSLSRQYSHVTDRGPVTGDHVINSDSQQSIEEIETDQTYLLEGSNNRHIENIENEFTDSGKKNSKRILNLRDRHLENGVSPIKRVNTLQHSKVRNHCEPTSSSPMTLPPKLNAQSLNLYSAGNDFSSNHLNSVENMNQLKGWTTCYTKLKALPGYSEMDLPDSTESIQSVSFTSSPDSPRCSRKDKAKKKAKNKKSVMKNNHMWN